MSSNLHAENLIEELITRNETRSCLPLLRQTRPHAHGGLVLSFLSIRN